MLKNNKFMVILIMAVSFVICSCSANNNATVKNETKSQRESESLTVSQDETEAKQGRSTYEWFMDVAKNGISNIPKTDENLEYILNCIEGSFPYVYNINSSYDDLNDEYKEKVSGMIVYFGYLYYYYDADTKGHILGDNGLKAIYAIRLNKDNSKQLLDATKEAGESIGLKMNTKVITGKISEGKYKVGMDIEEGEYVLFAMNAAGYFSVCKDANEKEIVFNDNFKYNTFITIKNGEYLKLSRCYAIPTKDNEIEVNADSKLGGMLRVGIDIPAGEYKLIADEDNSGYYCIYTSSRQEKIVANDNFKGQTYVSIKNGQYLEFVRSRFVK